MPSRFTAFDVRVGNCFLLELERAGEADRPFRMLVDAGKDANEAQTFLRQHLRLTGVTADDPNRPVIDVVTLTHTDADHLGGLEAVLRLPVHIRELWLPFLMAKGSFMVFRFPADMARAQADLVGGLPEHRVVAALQSAIEQFPDAPEGAAGEDGLTSPLVTLGDTLLRLLADDLRHVEVPELPRREGLSTEALADEMRRSNTDEGQWLVMMEEELQRRCCEEGDERWWWHDVAGLLRAGPHRPPNWPFLWTRLAQTRPLATARVAMLAALSRKGERVKNVAASAYRHQRGLRIRWFDYVDQMVHPAEPDPAAFPVGVINARVKEVIEPFVNPAEVLALITRDPSETNHTSLVLNAPAGADHPGALLSADSDFLFMQNTTTIPVWTPGMLITAPHHGAKTNGGLAHLYRQARQSNQGLSSIWVRSDKEQMGIPPACPGSWYTDLDHQVGAERYCTCCAGQSKNPSHPNHVTLTAVNGRWSTSHPRCRC
ncbi:hypothetical protein [Deinococcus aestuarii]|uniref:hypothetical protein n=1 Tax=Deinococcus aestuarii TaxID=2774531 RepID=UPI001FE70199|nr:hypothetical protein [Deinococcus aestuarii]